MNHDEIFVFTDVPEETFDFEKEWIVANIEEPTQTITYLYIDGIDGELNLTFREKYSFDVFIEKKNRFLSDRQKILNDRKQALQNQQITKDEYFLPIIVTEKFPKETFYIPQDAKRNIRYQ